MSIREEITASGATILRSGNGQFAEKPPAAESPITLGDTLKQDGFGIPAPRFVLRDQDENPEPFDETYMEKHGNRIASSMERLPHDRPSMIMQDLLEDIRCGYPGFSEEAQKGDYEVAVENLRHELSPVPAVERERYIEMITFGVHTEMEHRKDQQFYTNAAGGWADVTYQTEIDEPVEPIEATDINLAHWSSLTDRATAAAGKARLEMA